MKIMVGEGVGTEGQNILREENESYKRVKISHRL